MNALALSCTPSTSSLFFFYFCFSFSVTLSLLEHLKVQHSTFATFEKTNLTVQWYFSHTSKQIHKKLQYKEKVFEEFQGLPHFRGKMVLYSSTKSGSLKPWTNVPWPRRLDLGFWQNSNIARKFLVSLKVCLDFPEKWFIIYEPNLAL